MPPLQKFVECLGTALCEYATAALARLVPFETALLEVARSLHKATTVRLTPADLRAALRELVSSPGETVELAVHDGVAAIRPPVAEEFRETLVGYLELLPELVRQALRRPGDPDGMSVPEQLTIRRAEDWLLFLPDRLPNFRPGAEPAGVDHWRLENLRGLGPHAEVWDGTDEEQPELSPACLKFVTDPKTREAFVRHVPHIKQVLDLDLINGLIPLRSAYVLTQPPCLEYVHLPGYDLANVMHDARWKNDRPRPDQAALIAKRIARVVGKLHRRNPPVVHRGLKPSNVLLSPTDEGRVSVWVSDVGWGQVTAALPERVELAQAIRRSLRGSHGPLYASPQQRAGAPPDPRDDVYAIGVIWYQLLVRDPVARPPASESWAVGFRRYGLSDGQARLITACLSDIPADRPGDGQALADLIAANLSAPVRNGDSSTIRLRGSTGHEVTRQGDSSARLRVRAPAEEEEEEEAL
jgi:hypothetical protein